MNDLSDRIGRLPPEKQALFRLMLKQRGLSPPQADVIARAADADAYPLSFSQQRLWFLDQMAPGNAFYNEPLLALHIEGPLDRDGLAATIDTITRRHASLRTRFASVDGRPVQIIEPPAPVPIACHDLRDLPPEQREARLLRLAQEEAARPFDLTCAPLLRVSLIQLGEHEHTALLEMHHIITDGWSNRLLLREILVLYAAISRGQPNPLPEVPIRYVDFAVWQRERLSGASLHKLLAYWTRQLAGDLPVSEFPADFPRPAEQRYLGRLETHVIAPELSDRIRQLGKHRDCTLFMTLFAAFAALLQRYTGQEEIVIGTPVANRNRTETESVVGFFVNTLVMRVDVSGGPRFTELMERVRKVAVDAYAHEDLPFEKLVEVLRPERNLDRQALFQILFGLHNYPDTAQAIDVGNDRLRLRRIEIDGGESKVDWALSITDLDQDGIKVQINYNTDLYRASTMQRLLRQYENILCYVAAEPHTRLNAIPLFGADGSPAGAQAPIPAPAPAQDALRAKLKTIRRKPVLIDGEGENR